MTETLLDPIRAHCFFAGHCKHVVSGFDAQEVHDRMEHHYQERHQLLIDQIVGTFR